MLLPKLQAEGKSLDDLIAQLKQPLETQEVRFKLEAAGYRALGEQVIADFRNTSLEGFAFNPENEEGVRFDLTELYGDGWLLLRMSLHEPLSWSCRWRMTRLDTYLPFYELSQPFWTSTQLSIRKN